MRFLGFLIAVLCIFAAAGSVVTPAAAQGMPGLSTGSKEPVEITADKTLEWHRNETRFVAKGAAVARQGDSSIAAEELAADYRESEASSMEIYHLKATGGVVLKSADNTAYGEVADYDLDKGFATLSGGDLRMVSPDQTVTAQERFEYMVAEGRLNALGRAKVTRPKPDASGVDTLEADKVSAVMKEGKDGKRVLDTLEAFGNVVIVTPTEKITGAYGIYRAGSNKAELKGGVKILRGQNTLEGERAEVDLTTNVSKIFGGASSAAGQPAGGAGKGRVKGVFYPGSK